MAESLILVQPGCGVSPPVFSVIKKATSDAWKMDSASEKYILVSQIVMPAGKTIASIVEAVV
jgi:hypothetical protein